MLNYKDTLYMTMLAVTKRLGENIKGVSVSNDNSEIEIKLETDNKFKNYYLLEYRFPNKSKYLERYVKYLENNGRADLALILSLNI